MKIAFLILAHKNPKQINYLASKLTENGDDVYIHLDKKSSFRKEIKTTKNIKLLSEKRSFYVSWGSYEIIKATLQLVEAAKEAPTHYDYYWLLSGQDFPLLPIKSIKKHLSKDKTIDYIDITAPNNKPYEKSCKLMEINYPKWIVKNRIFEKIIKNVYMITTGGRFRTFTALRKKTPNNYRLYFGSQWWTLSSETIDQILRIYHMTPELDKYYEKTIIPDECFFQTIYMNSVNNKKRKDSLTFVNWKKKSRSPEIISKNDIDYIKKNKNCKFMARKFDEANIDLEHI